MSKRKWHTKAVYLAIALALTLGLVMMPATAGAATLSPGLTASPDKGESPLRVTFNVTCGGTENWTLEWDFDGDDVIDETDIATSMPFEKTTEDWGDYTDSGVYTCKVTVTDSAAMPDTGSATINIGVDPKLMPCPAFPAPRAVKDVKGAIQKFVIVNLPDSGLSEQELAAKINEFGVGGPEALEDAQADDDQVMRWEVIPGLSVAPDEASLVAGGLKGQNWIRVYKHSCGEALVCVWLDEDLEVDSGKVAGVFVDYDGHTNNDEDIQLCCEKKWGKIQHTLLDMMHIDPGIDRELHTADDKPDPAWDPITETAIPGGLQHQVWELPTYPYQELVADWVWADFLMEAEPGWFKARAGHAVVHWWLIIDDAADLNQKYINDLIDDLGRYDDWSGCGGYAAWPAEPKAIIDELAFDIPELALNLRGAQEAVNTVWKDEPGGSATPDTYIQNETQDDLLGETRGLALTELQVTAAEDVIIVVLVEYPDPVGYAGENPVCVEYGKKHFGKKPPEAQVKVPQVRWAGEKIVLEKDWGVSGQLVGFFLEEGSIGDLIPFPGDEGDTAGLIISEDARTAFTLTDEYGIARAMFKTEQQGQVDVECVLYSGGLLNDATYADIVTQTEGIPVAGNHGFLVYYLALEEILWPDLPVLDAGVALDPIPGVTGWFTSDALPDTVRPEKEQDVNNDDITDFLLPAGRYVLPDDWPLLGGWDIESRPWYDLMDSADLDNVTSTTQSGPWINVSSTDGEADFRSIGPFNTLQDWSLADLWIADATVPADMHVALPYDVWNPWTLDVRNTVVPNGVLDWFDCPMSQAEGMFEIVGGTVTTTIVPWDKGDFFTYGCDPITGLFNSPFYDVEIPSHQLIPAMKGVPMGYMWDSWNGCDGPYDYWEDLDLTTTDVIEVYGDNHSLFGCHVIPPVDGLGNPVEGTIILELKVDYPYLPCKYPAITSTIEITWGPVSIEMNPHFQTDTGEREFGVGDTVTFVNLTTLGERPYMKAEWDYDSNGVIDDTFVNPTADMAGEADVLVNGTWEYAVANVYDVTLYMYDVNLEMRYEVREDYITITGEGPMKGDFDDDKDIDFDDFTAFAAAYGSVEGETNYNVIGDFNDDHRIDFDDFTAFAAVYGYGT